MNKLLRLLFLITLAFFTSFSFGLESLLDGSYHYGKFFTTEADQIYRYDVAPNLTKTGKSQASFFQESGNRLTFAFVDSFLAAKGGAYKLKDADGVTRKTDRRLDER